MAVVHESGGVRATSIYSSSQLSSEFVAGVRMGGRVRIASQLRRQPAALHAVRRVVCPTGEEEATFQVPQDVHQLHGTFGQRYTLYIRRSRCVLITVGNVRFSPHVLAYRFPACSGWPDSVFMRHILRFCAEKSPVMCTHSCSPDSV